MCAQLNNSNVCVWDEVSRESAQVFTLNAGFCICYIIYYIIYIFAQQLFAGDACHLRKWNDIICIILYAVFAQIAKCSFQKIEDVFLCTEFFLKYNFDFESVTMRNLLNIWKICRHHSGRMHFPYIYKCVYRNSNIILCENSFRHRASSYGTKWNTV